VVVTSSYVEVVMLDGRHRFLSRTVVALHDVGAPWGPFMRTRVVTEARRFLGLQYLWAGTSGFGFDCSGLTHSVYRALGVTIPRDADAQYARGAKIALRSGLRWGDLVFFRNPSGVIHHVGLYVGDGRMIHAPATGQAVQITSIYRYPYYGEFAGGRRYV
jgi:cell wall-associated NlpC family hydrolase